MFTPVRRDSLPIADADAPEDVILDITAPLDPVVTTELILPDDDREDSLHGRASVRGGDFDRQRVLPQPRASAGMGNGGSILGALAACSLSRRCLLFAAVGLDVLASIPRLMNGDQP